MLDSKNTSTVLSTYGSHPAVEFADAAASKFTEEAVEVASVPDGATPFIKTVIITTPIIDSAIDPNSTIDSRLDTQVQMACAEVGCTSETAIIMGVQSATEESEVVKAVKYVFRGRLERRIGGDKNDDKRKKRDEAKGRLEEEKRKKEEEERKKAEEDSKRNNKDKE